MLAKLEQWARRLAMGKSRYLIEEVDSIRALVLIHPDLPVDEAVNLKPKERKALLQQFAEAHAQLGISRNEANVRVGPSLIPNAGLGVFATKTMPAGTIMCLFPGTVFRPDDVYTAVHDPGCPMYNRIFKQDLEHCVSMFDGSVLDAGKESEGEWTPHPFAVAHLCNHPDFDQQPNVMKLPFLWQPTIPVNAFTEVFNEPEEGGDEEEKLQLDGKPAQARELAPDEAIPNVSGLSKLWMFGWGGAMRKEEDRANILKRQKLELGTDGKPRRKRAPKWDFSTTYNPTASQLSVIRGLAFLSTREIAQGEELLMNYRLNPKSINKRPAWYHPVDEKEDTSRWGG
ncbi:hypothetical protein BASA81_002408 [Batrachochytrium salamandrivorans]|nr:hypothetical protein BASA81_002408 [Batrachochytrium salamandrivorans]